MHLMTQSRAHALVKHYGTWYPYGPFTCCETLGDLYGTSKPMTAVLEPIAVAVVCFYAGCKKHSQKHSQTIVKCADDACKGSVVYGEPFQDP